MYAALALQADDVRSPPPPGSHSALLRQESLEAPSANLGQDPPRGARRLAVVEYGDPQPPDPLAHPVRNMHHLGRCEPGQGHEGKYIERSDARVEPPMGTHVDAVAGQLGRPYGTLFDRGGRPHHGDNAPIVVGVGGCVQHAAPRPCEAPGSCGRKVQIATLAEVGDCLDDGLHSRRCGLPIAASPRRCRPKQVLAGWRDVDCQAASGTPSRRSRSGRRRGRR